jgi:hypothetical protein
MNLKQKDFDILVDINGSNSVLVEGNHHNDVKLSTWRKGFTPVTVSELMRRVMIANAEVANLQAAIAGTLTLINNATQGE